MSTTINPNSIKIKVKFGPKNESEQREVFGELYLNEVTPENLFTQAKYDSPIAQWQNRLSVKIIASEWFCKGRGGSYVWEVPQNCSSGRFLLPDVQLIIETPPVDTDTPQTVPPSAASAPASSQQTNTTAGITTPQVPGLPTVTLPTLPTVPNVPIPTLPALPNIPIPTLPALPNVPIRTLPTLPNVQVPTLSVPPGGVVGAIKKLIPIAIPPLVRAALARKKVVDVKLKQQLDIFKQEKQLETEKIQESKKSVEKGAEVFTYPLGTRTAQPPVEELPRAEPEPLPSPTPTPAPLPTPTPTPAPTKQIYFIFVAGGAFIDDAEFYSELNPEEITPSTNIGIAVVITAYKYEYFYNGRLVGTASGPYRQNNTPSESSNSQIKTYICSRPEYFGGLQPGCETGTYVLPQQNILVKQPTKFVSLKIALNETLSSTRKAGFEKTIYRPDIGITALESNQVSLSYIVNEQNFNLESYVNTFTEQMKKYNVNTEYQDKSTREKTIAQLTFTPTSQG